MSTNIRRAWDTQRLAKALTMPGIDPRHWVSYGTVGVMSDEGDFDPDNQHAVYVGPEGVEVDVLLEPLDLMVTAHYSGIQGGCHATITTPIKPGDRVLVVLPDGDPGLPPVIMSILHSTYCPVPLGADKKPIFRNDRVFVWAEDVDIDIRANNNVRLQVKQDGTILLGDGATEQLVKGTTYASDENTMLFGGAAVPTPPAGGVLPFTPPSTSGQSLLAAFQLLESIAVGPLALLKPGFTLAKQAIQQYQTTIDNHLSAISKTK